MYEDNYHHVYKVKNGPTLKAKVHSLKESNTMMRGNSSPRLIKTTNKDGKAVYTLFVVQEDTTPEWEWAWYWPFNGMEAILNYNRRGDNDPTYVHEAAMHSREMDNPGEYSLDDFSPQPKTDDYGDELFDCVVKNVRPDVAELKWRINDEDVDPARMREHHQSILARIESGEDLSKEVVELKEVPNADYSDRDLLERLEQTLGFPVLFESCATTQLYADAVAPKELPDWAWYPLEVYDHGGVAWNLHGKCTVDRQWDVSTGVGYVYMTKNTIEYVEKKAAELPAEQQEEYKKKYFLNMWENYCKPVLDGDPCEQITAIIFDEQGTLIETRTVVDGMYYERYKENENDVYHPVKDMEDYVHQFAAADFAYDQYEDITSELAFSDEYYLPSV